MADLPRFVYRDTRDAVGQLADAAKRARSEALHALPHNRYEPDDSQWWLSPGPETPAYRYGKLGVYQGVPAAPAELYVALVFEKGVGQATTRVVDWAGASKRWVMDGTWRWETAFVKDVRSGKFDEAALLAQEAAGLPLTVVVDAAVAVANPSKPWDTDWARWSFDRGALYPLEPTFGADLLRDASSATTLREIVDAVLSLPNLDWCWVDFHIGVGFERATEKAEAWSADDVWRRVAQPWAAWIR